MRIDFTKNETMRYLASIPAISGNSKAGREIAELIDGIGITEDKQADAILLAVFAYELGQRAGKKK